MGLYVKFSKKSNKKNFLILHERQKYNIIMMELGVCVLMVEENIKNAQKRLKKLHSIVDKNSYSRNNVYIFTTLHIEWTA